MRTEMRTEMSMTFDELATRRASRPALTSIKTSTSITSTFRLDNLGFMCDYVCVCVCVCVWYEKEKGCLVCRHGVNRHTHAMLRGHAAPLARASH